VLEKVVDDVAEVLVAMLRVVRVLGLAVEQLGRPRPEEVGVPARPVPEAGKRDL
jgi:hypothetical protein